MNDDSWKHLLDIAIHLIDQVNRRFSIIDRWTLGGGTAMMLRIGHRESRDIDIFIDDPQVLAYLNPDRQVFAFHTPPSGYHSDGSRFQRIVFDGIGEIDFIACPALTAQPATETQVGNHAILLETLPEIVAKKVFFRGGQIKPRDIFDIAAASRSERTRLVAALSSYHPEVSRAIAAIERSNREYIDLVIADLNVSPEFTDLRAGALDLALEVLNDVMRKH